MSPARHRRDGSGALVPLMLMRRFFKSAAFPILLVVILAFVAQKVITNDPATRRRPTTS